MKNNKILPDCKTCNHTEHKPGKCKNCNCGENEITRFSQDGRGYLESDYSDRITKIYNFQDTLMGERNYKVSRM